MQCALSVQLFFSSLSLFFPLMSVSKRQRTPLAKSRSYYEICPIVCEPRSRYLTENDRPANRTKSTSSYPVSVSCILILFLILAEALRIGLSPSSFPNKNLYACIYSPCLPHNREFPFSPI